MRFTEDQLAKAKLALVVCHEHCGVAFWALGWDDRLARHHAKKMLASFGEAAAALGYSFEPLPVTDAPGFDGRDDRSIGMKETDVT